MSPTAPVSPPPLHEIERTVQIALREDLGQGDVTTDALLQADGQARATILAEGDIRLAGGAIVQAVYRALDPEVAVYPRIPDGGAARRGQVVAELHGSARSLLMGERVALNFLQHLSGIATLTHLFTQAVRGYRCRIVDTRKTTPGLRALQKWAVRLGGGYNHRQSLGDGLLIKDNHLALLRARGVGIAEACCRARTHGPHGLRVIVESDTLQQVREALEGGPDVILLDNMSPAQVRQAVELIKGRALVEVSGGVSLSNARDLAAAGADYLSIGSLTHSAPAAPLTMDIVPARARTSRGSRSRGTSRDV